MISDRANRLFRFEALKFISNRSLYYCMVATVADLASIAVYDARSIPEYTLLRNEDS